MLVEIKFLKKDFENIGLKSQSKDNGLPTFSIKTFDSIKNATYQRISLYPENISEFLNSGLTFLDIWVNVKGLHLQQFKYT